MKLRLAFGWWLTALAGCGAEETSADALASPTGSVNVSQGGVQDMELFRSIIDQGLVPSPDVLDPVGFFAEHAVDLPPADCGQVVCVHPFLAVAPRMDRKSNWTMAFVAMNTSVDPTTLPRPPLHLAVTVERTSSTAGLGSSEVSDALRNLFNTLRPEDRVSVVGYGTNVEVLADTQAPSSAEVAMAITDATDARSFSNTQQGNLYGGLAAVRDILEASAGAGFQGDHRVLLLSSGNRAGIAAPETIVGLAESLVRSRTAFSVVGYGSSYDPTLPVALGSLGAGTYSYARDNADLARLLGIEGATRLIPLAQNLQLDVTPAPGYRVGAIYGARRATRSESSVSLDLPAVFVGLRDDDSAVGGSRRGGGGGLFVELIADRSQNVAAGAPAFSVDTTWTDKEQPAALANTVSNLLAPGENPQGMWPSFSNDVGAKAFMMLNMYLALHATLELYDGGDCSRALGAIDMMGPVIAGWQGRYADADITDDANLMQKLRINMERACRAATTTIPAPEPPERDFPASCMFL